MVIVYCALVALLAVVICIKAGGRSAVLVRSFAITAAVAALGGLALCTSLVVNTGTH